MQCSSVTFFWHINTKKNNAKNPKCPCAHRILPGLTCLVYWTLSQAKASLLLGFLVWWHCCVVSMFSAELSLYWGVWCRLWGFYIYFVIPCLNGPVERLYVFAALLCLFKARTDLPASTFNQNDRELLLIRDKLIDLCGRKPSGFGF